MHAQRTMEPTVPLKQLKAGQEGESEKKQLKRRQALLQHRRDRLRIRNHLRDKKRRGYREIEELPSQQMGGGLGPG